MDGGRASLVLASLPPATRPDGLVLTDNPSRIADPTCDVLLEDLVLADRYSESRYEAARQAFARFGPERFPAKLPDYGYAFVQAHVDLAVRRERIEKALRSRRTSRLAIPSAEAPTIWAAMDAARRLGITVERYPVRSPPSRKGGAARSTGARIALSFLSPFLFARFRRRDLRILTTDLGMVDAIVPHLPRRSGILSPGLGVAERMWRGNAAFAWLRSPATFEPPSLSSAATLEEAARALAIRDGGPLPDLEAAAREIFAAGAVDALALSEDKAPANHVLVRLAASARIPSVVVQHGITGHAVGFLPIHATRFASWGPACSEWLASRGASREAIVETGDPRYDSLFRNQEALRQEGESRLRSLGVPEDTKVAVCFSQPVEGRAQAFRMVLDATAGLPLTVVTKIHPAEGRWLYRGLAAQRGLDLPVASGFPNPFLCAADLVLTQNSGLAVVAAQLGTPVVLLEPVVLENLQVYDRRWPRADDAASLRAHLESIQRGAFDREGLRGLGAAYGGPPDGRAGERVVRLLEGLVRKHG